MGLGTVEHLRKADNILEDIERRLAEHMPRDTAMARTVAEILDDMTEVLRRLHAAAKAHEEKDE